MDKALDEYNGAKRRLCAVNGKWIAFAHTAFGGLAFVGTLFIAVCLGHVSPKNGDLFGYGSEWLLPVSKLTGYSYRERSFFQIMIAIASGPRFVLVFLWYLVLRASQDSMANIMLIVGLARTFACGGFVYVTTSDDHSWHDMARITYITLTVGWVFGLVKYGPLKDGSSSMLRRRIAIAMMIVFALMGHYFSQHRVYQVPGAYSKYALLEWILVTLDIAFDAASIKDLDALEIRLMGDEAHEYFRPTRFWHGHV
jgi:hypothetical protein